MDIPAQVFTLSDGCSLRLQVSDLGAAWLSCRLDVPGEGERELLLGHLRPEDHGVQPGYLGVIVGRYANRIAGARFSLDGLEHRLAANDGPNQLHGGPEGFSHRRWQVRHADGGQLQLRLHSPAGDQGFPGALDVDLSYTIIGAGELRIAWTAQCSAACPVNLSSHAYFNLDPVREPTIAAHRLRIAGEAAVEVDDRLIPTGVLRPVAGTRFDLRRARPAMGDGAGFDHCWRLRGARAPAATLQCADGRVRLDLATSLPGLQCYTGAHLAQARDRDDRPFVAGAGIALEPQFLPDSPNHPQWPQPSCIVRPGTPQSHWIGYRFTTPRTLPPSLA